MTTIVTRAGKGSALTNTEMDSNFTNLNTSKVELNVSNSGQIGLYVTPTIALVQVGSVTHPNSGTQLYGEQYNFTSPSTATAGSTCFDSSLATAAASFTQTNMVHFSATLSTKGAGSTITNVLGFYAKNAIAVGTNNYGFYSDITSGTNIWQLYMSGSAASYFGGTVQANTQLAIGTTIASGALVTGLLTALTSTTTYGFNLQGVAPSSVTTELDGYWASLTTANSSFTLPNLNLFYAAGVSRGAASTITSIRGFYAANAIASGTNNYGFYSDINSASGTYQLFLGGTADSGIAGRVAIGQTGTTSFSQVVVVPNSTLLTASGINIISVSGTVPSTATAAASGYGSDLTTQATSFTITALVHFNANSTTKGSSSTITNVYGFRARNGIAVGSSNYGFYSDINDASSTYAFYGSGSAGSRFNGPIGINVDPAGATGFMFRVQPAAGLSNASPTMVLADLAFASTAIANASGFKSGMTSAAASYTINQLAHFWAAGAAKGASSTIQNAYGFYAANSLAVGATNAGFYSDINSASATWQLYMSGTAHSRIAGGSFIVGNGALATNATDGFLYITTSAGAPSGTPTSWTGSAAFHFDSTNNRLYIYNGSWKSVAVA